MVTLDQDATVAEVSQGATVFRARWLYAGWVNPHEILTVAQRNEPRHGLKVGVRLMFRAAGAPLMERTGERVAEAGARTATPQRVAAAGPIGARIGRLSAGRCPETRHGGWAQAAQTTVQDLSWR